MSELISGVTTVREIGTSFGVILNKLCLEEAGISKGDKLVVVIENGNIILKKRN